MALSWGKNVRPLAAGEPVADQATQLARKLVHSLSDRHCSHQFSEPDEIEHPSEIVGERGQAELGSDLLQAARQKRTLVHPSLIVPNGCSTVSRRR